MFEKKLLLNADGQDIKFSKKKYGLLNQSRVGRSGIQFEQPRVGRSDLSSKFDPNNDHRYEESSEADTIMDSNNGRILKLEGTNFHKLKYKNLNDYSFSSFL